jgi:anti-sigma regulatory factor (Ser/Thr protein kinase)
MSYATTVLPTHVSPSVVTLVIPCKPEYVAVARLAVLGIAGRIPWSSDEVEDLRLAVGEVCADAIERASIHETETVAGVCIELVAVISTESLTIDIRDHVPPPPFEPEKAAKHEPLPYGLHDRQEVSDALITELVDSFERSHEMGGTVVRLVKRLPDGFQP